ncbi:redoxin domain-containing protein [Polyangium aurulentum]|nr:redoxin domain-containing protein [Polyangium aurulentum]
MPAVEALLPRFRAAHTQVLGVSVDSVYSHANWGRDLGGVSFPLLADFQPKGAMGRSYGVYMDAEGIEDRATVIIDSSGIVRYASSVTPAGARDAAELAALCEQIDAQATGPKEDWVEPPGLPADVALYIKSRCGFSRATLLALDNLHLSQRIKCHNVTEDANARAELMRLAGRETAPCFIVDGTPMHESKDIIKRLVDATSPL